MGLFTDPMTLVDEAEANRTFVFRAQIDEPGSIAGEYIEPLAEILAESKLVVKHSTSKNGIKRHLLQRAESTVVAEDPDVYAPIIVNLTVSHDKRHTLAQLQNQITLVVDAVTEANFASNLMRELL